METKEGLEISLESCYTHKVYNIIYKDIEYIYQYDYDNGMWDNESLERKDKQEIDDKTYSEIKAIIDDRIGQKWRNKYV